MEEDAGNGEAEHGEAEHGEAVKGEAGDGEATAGGEEAGDREAVKVKEEVKDGEVAEREKVVGAERCNILPCDICTETRRAVTCRAVT